MEALANKGAFGRSFPALCPDGTAIYGTDTHSLKSAIEAETDGLTWPLQTEADIEDDFMATRKPWCPNTLLALDLIEFAWRKVAHPIAGKYHDFFSIITLSSMRRPGVIPSAKISIAFLLVILWHTSLVTTAR